MLKLSKKLLCSLEAVLDIAYNAGSDPVQSKDITNRQGIPERYLEQVLQSMVRAGILKGVRGPRGGYRLARERRRITVGEIARVVYTQENDDETAASLTGSNLGREVVYPFWMEFQEGVMVKLDQTTIEDLCRQARDLGITPASMVDMDFNI